MVLIHVANSSILLSLGKKYVINVSLKDRDVLKNQVLHIENVCMLKSIHIYLTILGAMMTHIVCREKKSDL